MANTDDTNSGIYDSVARNLAEDDMPYAFLFGMASQLLRNLVHDYDDPTNRKLSAEFVRALDDAR